MGEFRYVLKGMKHCYVLKEDVAELLKSIGGTLKSFTKVCAGAGALYLVRKLIDDACKSESKDTIDGFKQVVNRVKNGMGD